MEKLKRNKRLSVNHLTLLNLEEISERIGLKKNEALELCIAYFNQCLQNDPVFFKRTPEHIDHKLDLILEKIEQLEIDY